MRFLIFVCILLLGYLYINTNKDIYFISIFFVWFIYLFSILVNSVLFVLKPNLKMLEQELIDENKQKLSKKNKLNSIYGVDDLG